MDRSVSAIQRLNRLSTPSLRSWGDDPPPPAAGMEQQVAVDCGWGLLIFGQTFSDHEDIIALFAAEPPEKRHIALYIQDHHVLLNKAPELLFVDPSHTYRLWLHNYQPPARRPTQFHIQWLQDESDAREVNNIYRQAGMIEIPEEELLAKQRTRVFSYFIARDAHDGAVIGTISGVDHKLAFNDPDNGASFWCLAVDSTRRARGVGRALVRWVAEHYLAKGRTYLDLSVLHDNRRAIRLYRALGFQRVPVYAVKKRNKINEPFYRGGPKP